MTVQSYAGRAPRPSSLADVLELVLDKGLVIDAYVRVSLVGIELLTIDARIVVASVDTYLRFAEATNRLDIQAASNAEGLPQLIEDMTEKGASSKTRGALSGVAEEVSGWFGRGDEDDEGEDEDSRRNGERRPRRPVRSGATRRGRDSDRDNGRATTRRRRQNNEDEED